VRVRPLQFIILFAFGWFYNTLTTGRLIGLFAIIVCLHSPFTIETIRYSANDSQAGAVALLLYLQ
jgi:hypothetical protein